MEIRFYEEKPDIETYYELRTSVGWENFCKEQAEKALAKRDYFVIAKDGEKAVGMGSVVGDGMYMTIVDVALRPEYQGQNIGSGIINKLVSMIEESAPDGARLSIQLIAAKGKEGFYEKQGFTALPCEDSGPALRKLIYT